MSDVNESSGNGAHEKEEDFLHLCPRIIARWELYADVREHERVSLRIILKLIQNNMERNAETDQEHKRAGKLKVEVLATEWEMILDGEEEVNDKDRNERDVDTIDDNLCWHAKGKVGHESEKRVAAHHRRRLSFDADGSSR